VGAGLCLGPDIFILAPSLSLRYYNGYSNEKSVLERG